jgi:hypothetical protein
LLSAGSFCHLDKQQLQAAFFCDADGTSAFQRSLGIPQHRLSDFVDESNASIFSSMLLSSSICCSQGSLLRTQRPNRLAKQMLHSGCSSKALFRLNRLDDHFVLHVGCPSGNRVVLELAKPNRLGGGVIAMTIRDRCANVCHDALLKYLLND